MIRWSSGVGRMGKKGTRGMVYSTIKWCHAHDKKFLFLLAPNDSGKTFLPEAQQLVRDLEDHDANPDLWAVAFYGPQAFRDKLEVLPESDAAGRPADTFSGVPYWLIYHLRDPKHWARLSLLDTTATKPGTTAASDVTITLANTSDWLDLTPVVRVRPVTAAGYKLRVTLDGADVSADALGDGVVFNRQRRLQPGASRQLVLHVIRGAGAAGASGVWAIDLHPNPAEPTRVNQTLLVTVPASSK